MIALTARREKATVASRKIGIVISPPMGGRVGYRDCQSLKKDQDGATRENWKLVKQLTEITDEMVSQDRS